VSSILQGADLKKADLLRRLHQANMDEADLVKPNFKQPSLTVPLAGANLKDTDSQRRPVQG